jgi:hypothetical protein
VPLFMGFSLLELCAVPNTPSTAWFHSAQPVRVHHLCFGAHGVFRGVDSNYTQPGSCPPNHAIGLLRHPELLRHAIEQTQSRANSLHCEFLFTKVPASRAFLSAPVGAAASVFPVARTQLSAFRKHALRGVDLAARLPDVRQKYLPQIYNVRVHRTDGTRRL